MALGKNIAIVSCKKEGIFFWGVYAEGKKKKEGEIRRASLYLINFDVPCALISCERSYQITVKSSMNPWLIYLPGLSVGPWPGYRAAFHKASCDRV